VLLDAACRRGRHAKAQSPPDCRRGPSAAEGLSSLRAIRPATNFSTALAGLANAPACATSGGVKLGGSWLADGNVVAAGGRAARHDSLEQARSSSARVYAEKLFGCAARSSFPVRQLNVANTTCEAASVAGYNGIVGSPPSSAQSSISPDMQR